MDERKHLTFALLSLAAFAQQPAPIPATVCPPVPAVPQQSSSRGQHPRPPPHGITLFSHFNYLFLFFSVTLVKIQISQMGHYSSL